MRAYAIDLVYISFLLGLSLLEIIIYLASLTCMDF